MKKRAKLLVIILLLLLAFQSQSQDQNYSQFFNNYLYYNPSFTGLSQGMRTSVGYRNQWTSLPVDFKAYNASIDFSERNLPGVGGFGLMVHNNSEGEGFLKNTFAALMLSSRVRIDYNLHAQFGVSAGVLQRRIDWDRLVFSDQLDGLIGVTDDPSSFTQPEVSSVLVPDFNIGIVLNYGENDDEKNARIGAAIHHIFTPKVGFVESESELPMRFVAHGDMVISLEDNTRNKSIHNTTLNPGIMYENQQGANSFTLGLNGQKSIISLGLWYRNEDINLSNVNSMIFLVGVDVPFNDESRMRVMYSYDYVMNNLTAIGGTHEISLIFSFDEVSVFGGGSSIPNRNNKKPIKSGSF